VAICGHFANIYLLDPDYALLSIYDMTTIVIPEMLLLLNNCRLDDNLAFEP